MDGVLGNASKVEHAYQLIRNHFVFTDKRFNNKLNIYDVQAVLASYVLR